MIHAIIHSGNIWYLFVPMLPIAAIMALKAHEDRHATYINYYPGRGWYHENAKGERITPYKATPGELDIKR